MLRACLLSLLFLAALGYGYYYWLDQTFEPPGSMIGGAIAGFAVMCCIGALNNARTAWGVASRVSSARGDLQLVDGRLVTVSGTIHPIGEPLIAPFTATPCVICEYDLASQKRLSAATDNTNSGSDYAGFLMTPCAIRTQFGDVRLLGFPILEDFSEQRCDSIIATGQAREFLRSHEFEDRTGLKFVTVLSAFGDIWSDDDGLVQKNMKLGKVTPEELFPPSLDADLLKMARLEQEHPERFEDDSDEDEEEEEDDLDEKLGDKDASAENEDDDDDDDFDAHLTTKVPKLVEKRVHIGEDVCAIGIYNEMKRGLLPPRGSPSPNRLLRGTAEQIEKRSRAAVWQNIVGGLIGLVVVHAVILIVMQVFLHSDETIRDRTRRVENAVRNNDQATVESLARRGFDLNSRDGDGQSLLMKTDSPEMVRWLIERGVDVNFPDKAGYTPLIDAARYGRTEIARILIDAKADVNARSVYGRTPLAEAVLNGHGDVAEMLSAAGAEE
jgi:hypothetical protein